MRLLLAVAIALVAGALTSFGQTYLPSSVNSLANSSGSWCALALLVALLPRSLAGALAAGVLGLLGLLTGYELTSIARGFAVSAATVAEWVLAAVAVGPFLGLGGHGLSARRRWAAVLGGSVLAGVLVGEGVYGLTVIADSTSPVWWTVSIVAGVLVPWPVARRVGLARSLAPAYLVTGVVAVAFWAAYRTLG